jgi:hypothetical protein
MVLDFGNKNFNSEDVKTWDSLDYLNDIQPNKMI